MASAQRVKATEPRKPAKSAGGASRASGGAYVALLRGINVGGKRSLQMKKLADVFVSAGCTDVRTYIQSGNVVFRAPPRVAARLSSVLPSAIAKAAGFDVPVVMRGAAELRAAVQQNPFVKRGTAPEVCHFLFLAGVPEAARVKALDAGRSPPDELAVVGRDVYLKLPNGVARSKLTNAYFDAKLGTVSTLRNFRTVLALLEMAEALSSRPKR